jgi:hypothetical protein
MSRWLHDERLVWVGVPLGLALIGVALVPPGRLPYRPGALFSDVTLAHWPNALFLRESVWHFGQWPLWRPSAMLGAPFAANPLSKATYPPAWLTLIVPPPLCLNLLIYVHLAWCGLGMLAWTRSERLPVGAGAMAAVAWALNPKLMAHLGAGHLDLLYAAAWAPWLLWGVRHLFEGPSAWRGAGLGAMATMLTLADVRMALYVLGAGVMYGLALELARVGDTAPGHVRRLMLAGGVALAVLALLTAALSLPILALGPYLTRARLTVAEAAAYSLPPRHLLGLLLADPGGFHEWMTYLGLPALALAGLAIRQREGRGIILALWGVALLAGAFALGDSGPLFPLMARLIPLMTWWRIPSRAWFVVGLAMACLAAWGATTLLQAGLGRRGRLAGTGVMVAGLVTLIGGRALGLPATMIGLGAALAGTGLGLWLAGGDERLRRAGLVMLGATLLCSLLALDRTLVEGRPARDILAQDADLVAALDEATSAPPTGRVYSPSFDLIGASAERAGLLTLHGVDPFQFQWSADAIARAAGVEPVDYSITAPPLPDGEANPAEALVSARPDRELLAKLGVRWIVSRNESPNVQTIEGPGLARVEPSGDAEIVALTPNRVTVHAEGEGVLIVAQAWAPGWRAWVDGEPAPVRRKDGVLQAVPIGPGEHTVELVYRPVADLIGWGISLGSAAGLIVWSVVTRRRDG